MMRPSFMITVTPRANPMISATPTISLAPATNSCTSVFSFNPRSKPDTTPEAKKSAVISSIHHPKNVMPVIMATNVNPNKVSIAL